MDSEPQTADPVNKKVRAPRRDGVQMAIAYLSGATIDELVKISRGFKQKSPRNAEFMRNELSGRAEPTA